MERIPMTPDGYARLQDELRHHREVLRPAAIRAIEEARAHGDLSENSEYDDAKDRQAQIEFRMRELDHKLSVAEVIDVQKLPPSDRVVFGATVTLLDQETEEELRYRIVGTDESDVKQRRISITSPIARALVGRSEGDEVTVKTPKGIRVFEILEVAYL